MSTIRFPFERGRWFTFADFLAFEAKLLPKRRKNEALDFALTQDAEPWMKLRNSEIYPLLDFARHIGVDQTALFTVCDKGNDVDVQLKEGDEIRRMQVTTAGPLWTNKDKDWGVDYKLQMEKLKSEGRIGGIGPFRRDKTTGTISNVEEAFTAEQVEPAFRAGLLAALGKKQHYRIPNCELLVRAEGYAMCLRPELFVRLARESLDHVPMTGFSKVHIFDAQESYIHSQQVGT